MKNRFDEKHLALLKAMDPEVTDFYADWLCMRESNRFETTAHLLAHLAREILRSLQDRVPQDVVKIYGSIIHLFDKFSHRREGGKAPRPKESFNQIWTEFENLLVYLVENRSDFYKTSNHCPFATLQNSLKQLETETSGALETEWMIPDIELAPHQSEISQNLEKIAPLFAAFYRDWVRMLRTTNFQCRSYMLAHLAREVDSGLRGALSTKQGKKRKQKQLRKKNLADLKDDIGHIASIMDALGINSFASRVDQWIRTVKDLADLTHKDTDDEAKLLRKGVESLWPKVESLWMDLVGGYLNLLDRVDRILKYEAQPPTDDQIKEALRNLLKFDTINEYFFQNLKSTVWLKPLKEDGCFNPENNPAPLEDLDHPGYYRVPVWYALEYVMRVADYTQTHFCDETVNTLSDIVNIVIDDHRNGEEKIDNYRTDWQVIRIIGTFPVDRIESRHIAFISAVLNSRSQGRLASQEIAKIILPKLVYNGKKDLILELLEVIVDAKVINGQIVAVMEYWLKEAFKVHGETLAKLCGVEVAEIALTQIRKLIADKAYSFAGIQVIEDSPSYAPGENYAELIVNFTSMMFRLASPDSIAKIVEDLIEEGILEGNDDYAQRQSRTIIGLIALNAIKHHYVNLKQLFWRWEGNPLDKVRLKPGFYQLIEANCCAFDEEEIDLILHWIETSKYYSDRAEIVALRKREWLTALWKTKNEKVVSLYEKYKKKNPVEIKHPGLNLRIETWAGSASPLTVEELSDMSNTQIAEFLVNFKEAELVISKSDPTEDGLAKTFNKCIAETPQRYTNNLQPFQNVQNFYQQWMLHGFLKAWRDKKAFDWAALLEYIHQLLLSERFWTEQHTTNCNYRQWTLVAIAELITSGTENDDRAFDVQLLPLAEQILLILVEKVEHGDFSYINRLSDIPSLNRSKVFTAMVNYTLRFAFTKDITQTDHRWPQAIKEDFTRRLNQNLEPSLEFSYILGAYLPYLSDLDEEWVIDNLTYIFPQHDEFYWQIAFSGYLLHSRIYKNLYSPFKVHGHYQKAIDTNFANDEVIESLVAHICIGWLKDWEMLDDDKSLIYQLMSHGTSESLSAIVHFFLEQGDKLRESNEPEKVKAYEQIKAKIKPAWGLLFEELSKNSELVKYQKVLGPLSGWLGLIDTIDVEVLSWMKESIRHINKPSGYYITISRVIKALLKHVSKTPDAVAEIYLQIPQCVLMDLQTEEDEINETVRILYNNEYKDIADEICNRFGEAGVNFLRSVYEEYQT